MLKGAHALSEAGYVIESCNGASLFQRESLHFSRSFICMQRVWFPLRLQYACSICLCTLSISFSELAALADFWSQTLKLFFILSLYKSVWKGLL